MCYNVKRMCIKSSPMGEGLGVGPVGLFVSVGWCLLCLLGQFLILNHSLSDCCSVATL